MRYLWEEIAYSGTIVKWMWWGREKGKEEESLLEDSGVVAREMIRLLTG